VGGEIRPVIAVAGGDAHAPTHMTRDAHADRVGGRGNAPSVTSHAQHDTPPNKFADMIHGCGTVSIWILAIRLGIYLALCKVYTMLVFMLECPCVRPRLFRCVADPKTLLERRT
jgi:hypothetical protein